MNLLITAWVKLNFKRNYFRKVIASLSNCESGVSQQKTKGQFISARYIHKESRKCKAGQSSKTTLDASLTAPLLSTSV